MESRWTGGRLEILYTGEIDKVPSLWSMAIISRSRQFAWESILRIAEVNVLPFKCGTGFVYHFAFKRFMCAEVVTYHLDVAFGSLHVGVSKTVSSLQSILRGRIENL
jgi:hypothetical protein